MRLRIGTAFLLLFSLAVLPGCPHDPYAHSYTSAKPSESDLVGTYLLSEESSRLVAERGGYEKRPASIILEDKGVLRFANVPDWWNTSFGKPGGQFDSAVGRWKVERKQDRWWALGITFPRESPLASVGGSPVVFCAWIMLVGERPPYVLHLSIGDPDEGDAMQFVKTARDKGR